MAKFNPDVPNAEPPSYLGLSKPIEQPAPDTSIAKLFSGLGETLNVAAKGFDEAVKANIQDQVYAQADTVRQIYTSNLEDARTGAMSGKVSPDILPPATDPSVPDAVREGVGQAESLVTSRSNGKISGTYYWGRLNDLAKSLRAQYPGYREFIDQEFSRITGRNPANAYMQSLASDINAAAGASQAQHNRIGALFNSEAMLGNPAARDFHTQWVAGNKTDEEAWQFLSRNSELYWNAKQSEAKKAIYNNNKDFIASESQRTSTQFISNAITNKLDSLTLPSGQNARAYVNDILTGKVQVGDEQAKAVGQFLRAGRTSLALEIKNQLIKDGRWAQMGDKAQTIFDNEMKSYDQIVDDVYNNNWGAAFLNKNYVAGTLDSVQAHFLSGTDTRTFGLKLGIANKLGGPESVKDFLRSLIGTDVPQQLQNYFANKMLDIHTQINPLDNLPVPLNAPPTTTVKDVIDEVRNRVESDPHVNPQEVAKLNNAIIGKTAATILSPIASDQMKINAAKALFAPSGRDLLAPGKFTPEDSQRIFEQLTSPAMTKEMYRLGQTTHQVWDSYKDTVNTWMTRVTFRNDVLELNTIADNKAIKLLWDGDKGQFLSPVLIPKNVLPGDITDGQIIRVRRTIDNLNRAISNIKNITDIEGSDINAYMLSLFRGNGYDVVRPENIPPTMTGAALRALVAANKNLVKTGGKDQSRVGR